MLITREERFTIDVQQTGTREVDGADGGTRTETYTYTTQQQVTKTVTVEVPDPPTQAQFDDALEALAEEHPDATVEELVATIVDAIEAGDFTGSEGVPVDVRDPTVVSTRPDAGLTLEGSLEATTVARVGPLSVASTADLLRSVGYPGGVAALFAERPEALEQLAGLLFTNDLTGADVLMVDGYVLGTVDQVVQAVLQGPTLWAPSPYNPIVTMEGETTGAAEHAFFGRSTGADLEARGLLGDARFSEAFVADSAAMGLTPVEAEALYLAARGFADLPSSTQYTWSGATPYAGAFVEAVRAAGLDPREALQMPPDLLLSTVAAAGGNVWALAQPYDVALLEAAAALSLPPNVLAARIDAARLAPTFVHRDADSVYSEAFLDAADDHDATPEDLARFSRFVAPPAWYDDAAPELQFLYRRVPSDSADGAAFGPSNAGLVTDFNGDGVVNEDDIALDDLYDLPGRRDVDDAALRMHVVQSIADAAAQIEDPQARRAFEATMASAVVQFGHTMFFDDTLTPLQVQENLHFILSRPELDLTTLTRFQGSAQAYQAYELIGATSSFGPEHVPGDAPLQLPASLLDRMGVAPGTPVELADVVAWLDANPDAAAYVAEVIDDHRAAIALTGDPTQLDRAIEASSDSAALRFLAGGVFALAGNPIEEAGLDLVAPLGTAGLDALASQIADADPETLARILIAGDVQASAYFDLMPPFGALVLGEQAQIEQAMHDIDLVARGVLAVAAPYAGIGVASLAAPAVITLLSLESASAIAATTWTLRLVGAASFGGAADGFLSLTAQMRDQGHVDWNAVRLATAGGVVRGAAIPISLSLGQVAAPLFARLPGVTPRVAQLLGSMLTGGLQGTAATTGQLIASGADLTDLTPEELKALRASLVISTASGIIPGSGLFDDLGMGMLPNVLARYTGEVTEEVIQEVVEAWAYAMDDADLMARLRSGEITVDEAFVIAADAAGSAIAETEYGMVIGTTLLITTLTGGQGDLDRVRIDLDNITSDPVVQAELQTTFSDLARTLPREVQLEFGFGHGPTNQAYDQARAVARFLLSANGQSESWAGSAATVLRTTEAVLWATSTQAVNAIAERYGVSAASLRALPSADFLRIASSDFWAQQTFRQTSSLSIEAQLAVAAQLVSPELTAAIEAGLEIDPLWIDAQRIVATSRVELGRLGPADPALARDFGAYTFGHSVEALGVDALFNADPNLSAQLSTVVLSDLYGRASLVAQKAEYVAARARGAPADPAMDRLLAQTSATYLPNGSEPFVVNVERDGAIQQVALDLPAADLAAFYAGDPDAAARLMTEVQRQIAMHLANPSSVFDIDADAVNAAYHGGEGVEGLVPADLQLSLRASGETSPTDPGTLTNLTGDPAEATRTVVTLAFDGDRVVDLSWRMPHANDAMPMNRMIEQTVFGDAGVALFEAALHGAQDVGPTLADWTLAGDPEVFAAAVRAVPEVAATYSLDTLLGDQRADLDDQIRNVINPALAQVGGDTFRFVSEDQLLLMAMTAYSTEADGAPAIGEWLVTAGGDPSGVGTGGAINPAALPIPAPVIAAYAEALETGEFVADPARGALLMDAIALFNHDRAMGIDGATMAVRMAHAAGASQQQLTRLATTLDPDRAAVLNGGQFVLGSRISADDPSSTFFTALSTRYEDAWGLVGAGGSSDKLFSVRSQDLTLSVDAAGADVAAIYAMIVQDLAAAAAAPDGG